MKKIIVILLIITLIFAFGCTEVNPDTNNTNLTGNNTIDTNSNQFNNLNEFTKIKNGDNVTMNYTLKLEAGEVYQTTLGAQPATFDIKYPGLIKGFYDAVIGMKAGDKKTITVPPELGYGPLQVQYIDINNFVDINQVVVGEVFSSGSSTIKIVSVDGDVVGIADRLSGETLTFDIEIISIN